MVVALVAACGTAPSEPAVTAGTTPVSTTQVVPTSTTAVPVVVTPSTVHLPLSAEMVLAGEAGVVLLPEGAVDSPVTLWSEPSTVAFAVGEDLVISQRAETTIGGSRIYPYWPLGPLVVFDPSGVREVSPPEGFDSIALHDADVVDGRPVALASIRTGDGPDDTEERLILYDLVTGAITDLGVSGGWEAGVSQARIVGTGAVAISGGLGLEFLLRHLEAGVVWQVDLPGEGASLTMIDNQVLVVSQALTGAFDPILIVTRFELESGIAGGAEDLPLVLSEGLTVVGGFCVFADAFPWGLSCDQTDRPPIIIDLQTGNTQTHPTQLRAVATYPRS